MTRLRRMLFPSATAFSSHGLLLRAFLLAAVFFVCHAFGMREYTSILSGTFPAGDHARELLACMGMVYVIMYLAAVVVAPILLIAAGLVYLVERATGVRGD